jgi:hypothetical protein
MRASLAQGRFVPGGRRFGSGGGVFAACALLIGLSACDAATMDMTARAAARSVVQPIVAERVPGIAAQRVTDCIIDSASANEIFTLASAAATGADETTATLVTDILVRPATVRCAATSFL